MFGRAPGKPEPHAPVRRARRHADRLRAAGYCLGLAGLAAGLGFALDGLLDAQSLMLVFLPVILVAAVRYGFGMAVGVAVLSVLATSFLFAEPKYSFLVTDPATLWGLAVMLAAAGLTSRVAWQSQQRAEVGARQAIALAEEKRRAAELADADRLRTALLNSISHDLRTPLASILGNVTSLRQFGHLYDPETRSEMLAFTEAETLRLGRFVDNLLHMTRIDAGRLRPVIDLIDLGEVVGAALKRLERTLAGHTVRLSLPDALPMIPLDFVLAEQVVVNLLENAVKYSPEGTTIDVSVSTEDGHAVLRIRDQGPGIAAADAERVFERFFRAESAHRRPAGTGLGLAICRGFVEAMHGRIRVDEPVPGRGAGIVVAFPLGTRAGHSQ